MRTTLTLTAAALLLAISGCTITYGPPTIITESVAIPDSGEVSVVASTGSVEVTGADRSNVEVTATVREVTFPVFFGPSTPAESINLSIDTTEGVTISHTPFDARGISVSYDVLLPHDVPVGSISTDTGSISVLNVAGSPVLHTDTGSITANGVTGTVTATTSTGSVNVRNAGAIAALSSQTGSITAEVRELADGVNPVSVTTSTGSIRLYLDPTLPLTIQAETSTGSITVDDSLSVTITLLGNGELEGTMNGGGTVLIARSSTGSISLLPLD